MASLKELRRKIKSTKSTQQITKAMKMVAAARMRRSQAAIMAARPFAVKLEATIVHLAGLEVAARAAGERVPLHPYFKAHGSEAVGLMLVTADKGLCGGFNTNLFRAAAEWLRKEQGRPVTVFVVGRKGRDFIKRLRNIPLTVESELAGIFPKVTFVHAEILGKAASEAFLARKLARVDVIYNEFKSAVSQRVIVKTLLPFAAPEARPVLPLASEEYEFLPSRHTLLESLLPRYLKGQVLRILLESQAAELAARMNAMDSASKNAGELIDAYALQLNRTRQAIITKEIAELVGGAEALAQ